MEVAVLKFIDAGGQKNKNQPECAQIVFASRAQAGRALRTIQNPGTSNMAWIASDSIGAARAWGMPLADSHGRFTTPLALFGTEVLLR